MLSQIKSLNAGTQRAMLERKGLMMIPDSFFVFLWSRLAFASAFSWRLLSFLGNFLTIILEFALDLVLRTTESASSVDVVINPFHNFLAVRFQQKQNQGNPQQY